MPTTHNPQGSSYTTTATALSRYGGGTYGGSTYLSGAGGYTGLTSRNNNGTFEPYTGVSAFLSVAVSKIL